MRADLLPEGIIPALVTPFRDDRFDRALFERSIERLNSTGVAGYVALGSTGEGVLVSDDEAEEVIATAASARGEGLVLIAGTGRESTRSTIALTRRAAKAGAEAVLVKPPSYYKGAMTDSALARHFRAVADASEVPVILYHIPRLAPVTFSPRLVLELAAHPNIVALKDTSGDLAFLSTVLRERPRGFRVYVGSASQLLVSLVLGADGGIHALANIAARECVALWKLVREKGDLASARELQLRLVPINQAVTIRFGVPGLKKAMELLGLESSEPRPPLEPIAESSVAELRAIVEASGLIKAMGGA